MLVKNKEWAVSIDLNNPLKFLVNSYEIITFVHEVSEQSNYNHKYWAFLQLARNNSRSFTKPVSCNFWKMGSIGSKKKALDSLMVYHLNDEIEHGEKVF